MKLSDVGSMSPNEITAFVQHASPEEIENTISLMNTAQIQAAIQQIELEPPTAWEKKTRAALLGLNSRDKLEAFAKQLTVNQVIVLIEKNLQIEDKHHWKLSPILVGMPFEVFSELLLKATDQQLHILQHEGVTEPVQHQLTAMSHELLIQMDHIEEDIEQFDEEIDFLNIEELTREDVLEKIHQIGLYSEFFERTFEKANKALAIAWNTKRLDLIESFNKIKDSCQKYNLYGIGLPRGDDPPTGLYCRLEEKLFTVYCNPDNPNDPEAVLDDEPALEGLVKFSVWYLRDYWEMGLLPEVSGVEELDLDLEKHSEFERAEHREKLFLSVQETLKKIGLATVLDLKKAYIFSKKTLQEYIER